MTRFLILAIVGLAVLSAAGPMLIALVQAVIPLIVAIGAVVLLLRGVWFFTNRW